LLFSNGGRWVHSIRTRDAGVNACELSPKQVRADDGE
jgi:hypothetical protein